MCTLNNLGIGTQSLILSDLGGTTDDFTNCVKLISHLAIVDWFAVINIFMRI